MPRMLIQKCQRQKMVEKCYHQNLLYLAVKSRCINEEEEIGLLSSLGIKIPLSNIPWLGKILF